MRRRHRRRYSSVDDGPSVSTRRRAMSPQVILSLSLLMGVSSVSVPDPDQPLDYVFSYGVNDDKTGSSFGHHETTDGQKTAGEYRVALPDGRLQVVKYTADENGYNAVVSYEGVAVHPDQDPASPTSPASPSPAVVTTVHPPAALLPTHPPAVLPATTRRRHPVPAATPAPNAHLAPTHPPFPGHPPGFPAPLPVLSNDIHRLPGPGFHGHPARPEPVRPRPKLISVKGEPIGHSRGPAFPHPTQGPRHSPQIHPHSILQFGPGHPAVAERPPPADLALFVPEEDLHKANFPSILSNAVPLHFGNALPLPVTPVPQHHGVPLHLGNPLPVRPISRHHGTPIPHGTTPVSHHITPVPHHRVTPVPHVGSFVHDITPIHDVTRAPHHGKQISHHVNPVAHHDPVVHHINSAPHNVPSHVAPGPLLPNSVPFLSSPSPFHAGAAPLHNGPLQVTPPSGLHHGHEPHLHRPSNFPHHPPPIPHHTSPITHSTPILHHTSPITHSTPIPHHTSPITHSTPIPHHTSPITRHSSTIPHHTSPITHSTPIPHHTSPITRHSSTIPHHTSPITHSTPIPHHTSPITRHTIPIIHNSTPIPHHTSPITHHSSTIPHHTSPITRHTSPILHHTTPLPHHSSPILQHSSPIVNSAPFPGPAQPVSFHPPASIRDKGLRRGKSFRNILGGGDIPPFLPGAPTLDRGQYLRHKGLERPGRSPRPELDSKEESKEE
ncbi:pollen-specific leucine-rich repeat extensin-like protein 1 [Penaeus japonicus]|uniref:pollen-specific leucine-rich repeat extensin-like protein 1 n=1 Tax=Penaeus japonicus TaxID=27405 RepID=UPI001C70E776|nr:pollen-specific leucine-rich repeat extensin-like protein 1 [Penaeus japonicus]